jgi:hypothetical protein
VLRHLPRPQRLVPKDEHEHRAVSDNVGHKADAIMRQAVAGCFLSDYLDDTVVFAESGRNELAMRWMKVFAASSLSQNKT